MFFLYPQEAKPTKELYFIHVLTLALQCFGHTFTVLELLYDSRRTMCTAVVIQYVLQPQYNVYDGRRTLTFGLKTYRRNAV